MFFIDTHVSFLTCTDEGSARDMRSLGCMQITDMVLLNLDIYDTVLLHQLWRVFLVKNRENPITRIFSLLGGEIRTSIVSSKGPRSVTAWCEAISQRNVPRLLVRCKEPETSKETRSQQ